MAIIRHARFAENQTQETKKRLSFSYFTNRIVTPIPHIWRKSPADTNRYIHTMHDTVDAADTVQETRY